MSGPECCANPPTLNPASGSGHVEKLGGLDSYVTGPSHSNRAILLVSDVYGYEAPNLRKLADKVAADGFYVVVPDFIHGDPYAPDNKERQIQVWLKDHEPVKGCEDAKKVIAALKSRGISAVGAAGFCWGGMVVVKLASSDDIKAAVILHPGWITADEINAVKVPTAILGAETDQISPPEQMKQFGEILAAKSEFESYVKIFDGAVHGWTLRYNDEDDSAVKKAEEAHSDMLNWFTKQKHIKIIENVRTSICCDNPPTLNPASGSGHVQKLGGLDSYVAGSSHSNRAIILVSDVYGYEAPNLRKLADKVAADGFYVVVPDFIHGDPYAPDNKERPIQVWLKDHGTDKGFEEAKSVVEALKSKGVSAVGAAGFCWGAKVVVELAKSGFIQGAVILHPSFVSVDDIKAVEVPIAILGAEIDQLSPPTLVKQFEEVLNTKPEIEHHVKIFPKVVHGWTVRYNVEDENAVKSANEAHTDMIQWFTKHVK